ncbi:transposase [Variovorax gossypii]|uniref:Transposase n=1 Tax=Variovorax gossypii TaxID=1679495 RepID=A0A3S0J8Z8_9BURK|nr:transposase [Variovorax gossypii]MDP9602617.1 transposase [Variovorax paradoxus]RTQ34885.1 transposase [Variovorax gossypii]
MKWTAPMRVTMQELDARLSKIVEHAREEPVAVNRYGSPWVWIVSHQAWVQADNLRALVPEGHPLVALHDLVEDALRYERPLLADLELQYGGRIGASTLLRSLVLQIVYSLEDGEKVHESLTYNMLFRWFVGFEKFADELPGRVEFTRDLNAVGADPRVARVITRCLSNTFLPESGDGDFRVNRGLLHALSTWACAAVVPEARPHQAAR